MLSVRVVTAPAPVAAAPAAEEAAAQPSPEGNPAAGEAAPAAQQKPVVSVCALGGKLPLQDVLGSAADRRD